MRRVLLLCLGLVVACAPPASDAPRPEPEPEPAPLPGRLVINEVNCSKNPEEFVEIANAGALPISTAGHVVAGEFDDDNTFPVPERVLAAGERVVIAGDLGLSCKSEGAVLLFSGVVVDDAPVRGGDVDRTTWSRVPDLSGPFQPAQPTRQKVNKPFVDERDTVFDIEEDVAMVDIFVDSDSENLLRQQGKDAGYVPALFMFTDSLGTSAVQRADVRIKGSITLREWDGKPSMKINFARHNGPGPIEFRGLRKMTLNNLTYDTSYIREFLSYSVMREAGHPAPRVTWINVFVNGEDKGLYTTIETYDRVFLADHYAGTQVMYESDGQTSVGSLGGFDVDEGEEDFAPLIALATTLDSIPAGTTNVTAAVPEVDWRQIARVFALEDAVGHIDGHKAACHNFFLHVDGAGTWTALPWSVDLSLLGSLGGDDETPLGSCAKVSQLCDSDSQCRAWFERDRDRAAQQILHRREGSWRDVVVPIAERLQPFAHQGQEPFTDNGFTDPEADLVKNANAVVDALERRAQLTRCAAGVLQGQPSNDATADCNGFASNPTFSPGR